MRIKNIEIPFFPLGVTLLPNDILPLRIFEPRYIQLINDTVENDTSFGIPYVRNSVLQDFGSEVRVTEILKRRANGEMVITIEGLNNFQVIDYKSDFYDRLYSGGVIKKLSNSEIVLNDKIIALTKELRFTLKNNIKNSVDLYEVANYLKLNDEEKFQFLSLPDIWLKEAYILKRLAYFKLLKIQEEKLQKNFSLN